MSIRPSETYLNLLIQFQCVGSEVLRELLVVGEVLVLELLEVLFVRCVVALKHAYRKGQCEEQDRQAVQDSTGQSRIDIVPEPVA